MKTKGIMVDIIYWWNSAMMPINHPFDLKILPGHREAIQYYVPQMWFDFFWFNRNITYYRISGWELIMTFLIYQYPPTKVNFLPEDNCFGRCFAYSQFKLTEVLYYALWCHRCTIWWSACLLFNEKTFRQDFKIHNVMCIFMDKHFSPRLLVHSSYWPISID